MFFGIDGPSSGEHPDATSTQPYGTLISNQHVTADGFGSDVDIIRVLLNFIEKCNEENITFKNGYHRKVVLRELYSKIYGLHEPGKGHGNHLDLVAMSNKEGHWELGPLPRRMKDYYTFKIWDMFHLSWAEWVDQPRYIVEYQLTLAMRDMESKLNSNRKQIDEIDEMIKAGKLDAKMRDHFVSLVNTKNKW